MSNGQQRAREIVGLFLSWKENVSGDELAQMEYRGSLKRTDVAKTLGCTTSAFRQNPALKEALAEFEGKLRDRGILPPLTENAKEAKEKPVEYDQTARQRNLSSQRASALEKENIELKAKVAALEEKLERYTELSDALSDLGVIPS